MYRAKNFAILIAIAMLVAITSIGYGFQKKAQPAKDTKPAATRAAEPKADNKVLLTYKAKKDQVTRTKSEGALALDAGGNKVNIDVKTVDKITYTDVAANGNITLVSETESYEATVNGTKMPDREDSKDKTTLTIKPDGTLVAYKSDGKDEDQEKLSRRLFYATHPVFPDKPVGVGDKWTKEYKADTELGTAAGKADFEVLALEKASGVDAVKIKMAYKESESSPPLTSNSTLWIEKTSGDTVVSEVELENVPFGSEDSKVMVSAKMRDERTGGSPLGDAVASAAGAADPKKDEKKEKTIDEFAKDMEKLTGLFTLYRKKEAGRDNLYLEIKESQLEKLMMIQVTASTGSSAEMVAGNPINDIVFKFSKRGDDLVYLVVPNEMFKAIPGTPLARSVERSYAEGYLEAFKIEAKQPDRKSLLVNVTDIFRSDFAQISQALGGGGLAALLGAQQGGYSLDREKTYIASIKMFPENLAVQTAFHFTKGRGSGAASLAALLGGNTDVLPEPRSLPLKVNFLMFPLEMTGYTARFEDPRVGFFSVEHTDVSNDTLQDQKVRQILRWRIEKADPNAALSAPKKPIVMWLDNAIPLEYRDAVRDGVLAWNPAFEKVGIKDAIVVKQMPDNADWDHADMRYNIVRWVSSPDSGYAVTLFRPNPFTGEILSGSITVDANIVRVFNIEYTKKIDPSTAFDNLEPDQNALTALKANPYACQVAQGATHQAWFGWKAISLLGATGVKVNQQEYSRGILRWVVSHEMGHLLGLRHNFVASTMFSLDEMGDQEKIGKYGITGSVMDYVPFNISALKKPGVDFWAKTIGPYDYWAIEYGYTQTGNLHPAADRPMLRQVASRSNEFGHAYLSDEYAMFQWDPRVTQFDLARDPMEYWQSTMELSKNLLRELDMRSPKTGDSYFEFTTDFYTLFSTYAQAAANLSRYVGGLEANRNHRGDPGEKSPLKPVDSAKQLQALTLLREHIFSENAFNFPKSYFLKLTANPNGFDSNTFPIRDTISNLQISAMRRLFNTGLMSRVINNEYKTSDGAKKLTLPMLFNTVGAAVWSEVGSKKNVGDIRRQLQRAHLALMTDMFVDPKGSGPEDAKMLAWDQLRQIKQMLMAAKQGGVYDDYTRIHLDESLMRVNRALTATQSVSGAAPPQTQSILQLLGLEADNDR